MIEKFVAEQGINYPTGAGATRAAGVYGISGYPSAFLIDHEGTVIWKGHPSSLGAGMIRKAIEKAEADGPWDPGERHEVLEKAVELARAGEMGKAWKAAESARKRNDEDATAVEAVDQFLADIRERGKRVLAKAQARAEEGRYFQATEYLEKQCDAYKGSPLEDAWKDVLKAWRRDKQAQEQYDLDEDRLDAIRTALEGEPGEALDDLKELIEDAEGLPIQKVIQADYEALRNNL